MGLPASWIQLCDVRGFDGGSVQELAAAERSLVMRSTPEARGGSAAALGGQRRSSVGPVMPGLRRYGGDGREGRQALAKMAETPVQISLRPYASSIPLASFAFGVGNVLYSAFLLHWIPASEARLVGLMLLVFVAPLELGPSVMAFLARDAGGATAFAIFGAAWVIEGLALLRGAPPPKSPATGVFALCLAMCLVMLTIVTFKGKPLLGVVLLVAIVRTAGAATIAFTAKPWATPATAWCGLLLAALAFYSGVAFLEEDVTQRLSPLTFRTGEARAAMEGELKDQVATIEKEAGVRKQL